MTPDEPTAPNRFAKKRKKETNKKSQSNHSKSSHSIVKDILVKAIPSIDPDIYAAKLVEIMSYGETDICYSHLQEEDLDFMNVADRRALWYFVSGGKEAEGPLRHILNDAVPGIPKRDLDRYVVILVRDGYDATDFENIDEMDLTFMRKVHMKKLQAAFHKRRKTSKAIA